MNIRQKSRLQFLLYLSLSTIYCSSIGSGQGGRATHGQGFVTIPKHNETEFVLEQIGGVLVRRIQSNGIFHHACNGHDRRPNVFGAILRYCFIGGAVWTLFLCGESYMESHRGVSRRIRLRAILPLSL